MAGSAAEGLWDALLDLTTDNGYILYTVWTNIVLSGVYWLMGTFYIILDTTNPPWIQKYKTQPGKNEPVDQARLRGVLQQVLFNQFMVGPAFVSVLYPLACMRGMNKRIRGLPSVPEFLLEFIGSILVREVYFYYSHRILHMRQFYETFHKKHHEWTTPVAVSAIYCTPLEHVFSNLGPVALGPFLFNSHFVTAMAFGFYAIAMTLHDHSGYRLPFYFDPSLHDYHHEKFNANFGIYGFMDKLHGTDRRSVLERSKRR